MFTDMYSEKKGKKSFENVKLNLKRKNWEKNEKRIVWKCKIKFEA